MYTKKNLPISQYEVSTGKEDKRFDRSNDIRLDDTNVKELTIGLYDLDYAIKWYFDNIIKPEITDFGEKVQVPVMYGSPEKWKNIQDDGYFRDKSGKIQAPLISYRRVSVVKNKTLGSKIDANYPQLYYTQELKYSQKNRYDQFSKLTNVQPVKQYINTVMPEFVDITYDVIVWTDFVEHMNGIVESILYTEGSFWGEPDRFKFRTKIDSFTNTTDLLQDQDRIVRTNFSITLFGYIIPDVLAKSLSKKQAFKTNSAKQLGLQFNADADSSAFQAVFQDKASFTSGSSVQFTSPIPQTTIIQPTGEMSLETLIYLNANLAKVASTVTPSNTAVLAGTSFLTAPANLPTTGVDNFQFFINGQHVEPAAVTSFVDNGNNTCTIVFNTAQLGFTLIATDEVVAVGKFA
jgi:hypothetical protein